MGNRQGVEGSIFSLFGGISRGRLWPRGWQSLLVSDFYRLSQFVFNEPDCRVISVRFSMFSKDTIFRGVGQMPETLAAKNDPTGRIDGVETDCRVGEIVRSSVVQTPNGFPGL